MTRYQTTQPIKSLANNGVNLGAQQPVVPQAFTPKLWAALLAEGVVIEIAEVAEMAVPDKVEDTAVSIDGLDIDQLKALADKRGIEYTWNMKRETLIERLQNA